MSRPPRCAMIYDVTVTLREGMPVYPGDPDFRREVVLAMASGGASNLSFLEMSAHHGTHVDAPLHMIEGGRAIDAIPPSVLVGPAQVVAITDPRRITRAELEGHDWAGVERALFKTANSGRLGGTEGFRSDFVHMDEGAAQFLAGLGLLLVGVDYLSLDPVGGERFPAHKALLGAGVVVVEGLDLSEVPPGQYELFCGPLKIQDGDGAPARVLLRTR